MKVPLFLALAGCICVFQALLQLALNRWKFDAKGFAIVMGYSLGATLPVIYALMFAGQVDKLAYSIVAGGVVAPFVAGETRNLVKGRGPRLRSVFGITGILCMMSTPLFEWRFAPLVILAGMGIIGAYLAFHFRYPAMNPMWLDTLLREAAASVPHECGYTSKPITVFCENRSNFMGGSPGFGLYARKDRTTMWMKRRLHERLGSPNLELLAREIARRLGSGEKEGTK